MHRHAVHISCAGCLALHSIHRFAYFMQAAEGEGAVSVLLHALPVCPPPRHHIPYALQLEASLEFLRVTHPLNHVAPDKKSRVQQVRFCGSSRCIGWVHQATGLCNVLPLTPLLLLLLPAVFTTSYCSSQNISACSALC